MKNLFNRRKRDIIFGMVSLIFVMAFLLSSVSTSWAGNCSGSAVSSCSSMSSSSCSGYIQGGTKSIYCVVKNGVCTDGGSTCNGCPGNGNGNGGDKCTSSNPGYCWSNKCDYNAEKMNSYCTDAPSNCPG